MGVGPPLVGTGANVWGRFLGDAARPNGGNRYWSNSCRTHWRSDYTQRSAVWSDTLQAGRVMRKFTLLALLLAGGVFS
jgi:hypothetical protein